MVKQLDFKLNLPFPFIALDEQYNLIYINKAGTDLLNIDPSITSAKIELGSLKSDFSKEVLKILQKSREENLPFGCELKTEDRSYLVSASPINGPVRGVSAIITDMTQYRSKEQENTLLYHITSTISSNSGTKEICEKILLQIVEVMNLGGGNIMLIDNQGDTLFAETTTSIGSLKPIRLKMGEGIAGWVAATGQPLATVHTINDKRYLQRAGEQDRSLLSVPLSTKGHIIGVLNLWKEAGKYFTESQVQTFSIIASRIADILNMSKMRAVREARLELAQLLNSSLDLKTTIDRGLSLISKIIDGAPCSIYLWDDQSKLEGLASTELIDIKHKSHLIDPKDAISCFDNYTTLLKENSKCQKWIKELINEQDWAKTTVSGLIGHGRLYGLLVFKNPATGKFSNDALNLIKVLSIQLGTVIENNLLYLDIKRERDKLETISETTDEGLLLFDNLGRINFYNQSARKILGLKKDIFGMDGLKVLAEQYKYFNHQLITQKSVFKQIASRKPGTYTIKTGSPANKTIQVRIDIIKGQKDMGSLVMIRDITQVNNLIEKQEFQVEQLTNLFAISNISGGKYNKTINSVVKYLSKLLHVEGSTLLQYENGKWSQIVDNNWKVLKSQVNKSSLVGTMRDMGRVQNLNINDSNDPIIPKNTRNILAIPLMNENHLEGIIAVRNKISNERFNRDDLKLLAIAVDKIASLTRGQALLKNLLKEKERLSSVIESSADGIFAINQFGQITLWNEAMEKLTGTLQEDAILKVANQTLLVGKDKVGILEYIDQNKKKNQKKGSLYEIEISNKNGTRRWVGIHYAKEESDEAQGEMILVLNDISRYKELDRQKNEFISMTAHELRTPLTAIKGYLSMIKQGDAGPLNEKQEKFFNRTYRPTERLVGLVEDLLNVIRIEEKRMIYNYEAFDLKKITKEVLLDFKEKARQKNISMRFLVDKKAKEPLVWADSDRTKQIVCNLVDNAIKYTPKGGKITIKLRLDEKEEKVITEIEDTGVGIDHSLLKNIFEKNYRVNNILSNQAGGYGLGLFITKSIVTDQRGEIWVKSRLGKGSIFFYSLPLKKKLTRERKK